MPVPDINNIIVQVIGSTGLGEYTGIHIDVDGSMTPERKVTVQVFATSPDPFTWQIAATSDVESTTNTDALLAANVGIDIPYDPADEATQSRQVKLRVTDATPAGDDYNVDVNATVHVIFKDGLGNSTTVSKTIRLNTKIYKSAHPAIATDEIHQPLLRELTGGGIDRPIPQTMIIDGSEVRAWAEVFYPATHSYKVDTSGNVDTTYVFAPITVGLTTYTKDDFDFNEHFVEKSLGDGYDPVSLTWDSTATEWKITTDADGRIITASWTRDGTKDYENMLSSSTSSLKSWVFDNSGLGDFQLEFEYFDLEGNIFGPPFNPTAPHKGDVLVVYDATDPDALETYVDAAGKTRLRISDSTLLREIMAFTGSGVNVINIATGLGVNAGPNGEFTTPTIVGMPKVAMILYTDASATASGFKLKSGRNHQRIWSNWDLDPAAGELWIHKNASLGPVDGAADTTQKMLIYSYQQGSVTIDYETGEVTFGTVPGGTVTADFSYYTSSTPGTDKFIASWDDLVDYQEAPIYAGQVGAFTVSSEDKGHDFNDPTFGYGRIVTGATWDKDKGVVTLSGGVTLAANQRLFADHYHHTYTRLTSDGHGDMVFRHNVLVADLTDAFPDYTWGDVKIVNEGDAALEQGVVKFGFRGYDTNNDGKPDFATESEAVDRVLDPNRPWDLQKGTKDETFDRLGMFVSNTFIWSRNCPRPANGQESNWGEPSPNPDPSLYRYENMTARGILQQWHEPVVGKLSPREIKYGRLVWALCGSSGSSYPTQISAGPKRCSMEVSGKYFDQLIF